MNIDELMAYAKENYPIGTEYKGIMFGNKEIAYTPPTINLTNKKIWVGNDYIYNDGEWATITKKIYSPPQHMKKFKFKVGDKVMFGEHKVTITGINFTHGCGGYIYRIIGIPNGHDGYDLSYNYDENGKELASYYDHLKTSYFVEENELAYCWYEPALNRKRKHRYTQYSIGQKVKVECEGKELIGTIEGFEFQRRSDSPFQFMNWIRFKGKSHGHDGRSKDYNYNEYGEVFEFKTSNTDYWFLPVENIIKDEEILPIEFKSPPFPSREGEGKACILGTPKGEIVVNFKEIWEKDLSSYKTFKQEYPYYWNTDAVDFGCIDLNPQTKTLPHQSAKVMKVNKGKPKLSIAKK